MWNDVPFPQLPDEGQAVSMAYGALGVLGDDVLSFQGHESLGAGEAHMLGEAPHTLPASVSANPYITGAWSKATAALQKTEELS